MFSVVLAMAMPLGCSLGVIVKTDRLRRSLTRESGGIMNIRLVMVVLMVSALSACTQETQNKFGRAIQNWTGTNGVLEIYAGEKLVRRFIEIDKLSTAVSTQGSDSRPYRFGYGVFDENLNMHKDPGEKKVYFEFSDYSTPYVFFEHPHR
jgi:hypothetical protein